MSMLRRHTALLLTLLMSLLLLLTPAAAAGDMTITELGDALREAQAAFDQADADYDALCETVFALNECYENGSDAEKLRVQDALLEAMIGEEAAYDALDTCTAALEELNALHAGMVTASGLKAQKLTARGYDSTLTILVWLDGEKVIWDIQITAEGNEQDKAVEEDSFLIQFIGRALPLSTNRKDDGYITLLSEAKKTSQAVVDAVNGLADKPEQKTSSGPIIEPQAIADYLFEHGKLPDNFITKKEAQALGWDSSCNYVSDIAPGKSIGGDRFGNYEGQLPSKKGRQWYEADCYYTKGRRNACRILYSSDGLVYYTDDHYETFTQMFPSGN